MAGQAGATKRYNPEERREKVAIEKLMQGELDSIYSSWDFPVIRTGTVAGDLILSKKLTEEKCFYKQAYKQYCLEIYQDIHTHDPGWAHPTASYCKSEQLVFAWCNNEQLPIVQVHLIARWKEFLGWFWNEYMIIPRPRQCLPDPRGDGFTLNILVGHKEVDFIRFGILDLMRPRMF